MQRLKKPFFPHEKPNPYNGECGIWLYMSNLLPGKESKVSIQGVSRAFFPEGAVVASPTHSSSCGSKGWVRKGLPFLMRWNKNKLTASHEQKGITCPCAALSKDQMSMFFMTDRSSIDRRMATPKQNRIQSRPGSCLHLWQKQLLSQKYKNKSSISHHPPITHDF